MKKFEDEGLKEIQEVRIEGEDQKEEAGK